MCGACGLLVPYCYRVSAEIEHPEIRYFVYPVHLDDTLTGGCIFIKGMIFR